MGRLDAVFHGTCGQGVGLSAEVMGTVPLYHGPRALGYPRVRASLCRCAGPAIIESVFQRRPKGTLMPLPPPVEALWNELQSVRAEILKEVEGLSQGQADWRPSEQDWSDASRPALETAPRPLSGSRPEPTEAHSTGLRQAVVAASRSPSAGVGKPTRL